MNQTPPRVTVCIPVYNEADVIERTLDCVLRQTISDFKVIISDNCSTDGTYEKITSYVSADPRFEVIRQNRNLGSLENFRFLSTKVETKYAQFLGSHDEVSDNLLEDLLSELESNKKLIGVLPRIVCDEASETVVKPQFDLSNIGNPVSRYVIALLGKHFAVHGMYRSKQLKRSLAEVPNIIGCGALLLCRIALLGRVGTSEGSTYHFKNRTFKVSHQERRRRHEENMQLRSSRFTGTRLVWEFLKLSFGAELPKKASIGTRISLLTTFPVVLVRYSRDLATDYRLGSRK